MPVFRIFCELLSKMASRSPCLCGFPECTVEMGEARTRALTRLLYYDFDNKLSVEMGEARTRALTLLCGIKNISISASVEMRVARFRALTLAKIYNVFRCR